MPKIVTVPLDLTPESERALPWAAALAVQLDAALELLVVSSPQLDPLGDEIRLQEIIAGLDVAPIDTVVLPDADVREVLTRYAADPDRLVCLASHGPSALGELLFGSVALDTVRSVTRPVLIIGPHVPADQAGAVARVVLGVDRFGARTDAVDQIADLAGQLGATVDIVHVSDPAAADDGAVGSADAPAAAAARLRRGGLAPRVERRHGDLLHALADEVGPAQASSNDAGRTVLAVTTRVEGRRARLWLGSTAGRLLRVLRVPLLVVAADRVGLTPPEEDLEIECLGEALPPVPAAR